MKINSTAFYLSQVLYTLKTSVIPGTSSEPLQLQLDWIRKIIEELLKRQGPATQLLRDVTKNGEYLEAEIQTYLGFRPKMPPASSAEGVGDFDELVECHAALNDRLNDLTMRLLRGWSNGLTEGAFSLAQRAADWEMEYFRKVQSIQPDPHLVDPGNLSTKPALTKDLLQKFIDQRQKETEVLSLDQFTNGFGKQTYFAKIKSPTEGAQEVVIRKSDATPVLPLEHFNIDQEFSLVRRLSTAGFPCPQPIELVLPGDDLDGNFWIMHKSPGRMISSFFESGKANIADSVFKDIATFLAKLHNIPLQHFHEHIKEYYGSNLLTMDLTEVYRQKLKNMREQVYKKGHLSSPTLSLLLAWCENNIPKDSRQAVLVHGDFNVHNMLGENGRVTTILDWETATFGAPEQDLAYIRSHVAKLTDWGRFMQHYRDAGGLEINEDLFGFYLGAQYLLMNLGLSNATWNLQNGYNREIRFVSLEMGFTPFLFQAAINCCQHIGITVPAAEEPDAATVDLVAEDKDFSQSDAQYNGVHEPENTAKTNDLVNSSPIIAANIFEKDGKRYTKTSEGRDLEVFGHGKNLRHKATTQELYQESVVLVWWDVKNKVGGFHRLGHEPNFAGGKVLTWNYIASPQGIFKRQTYLALREEDSTPTGGFGSGDGNMSVEVTAGDGETGYGDKHIWTVKDPEHQVTLHLEHVDTGPNVDCYPKSGTLSSEVAPAHFDIGGIAKGKLQVKSETYEISALSFRDKGYGPRDWTKILSHRWVAGTCGPELTFIALTFHSADDQMTSFGWVVRNGVVTTAKTVDVVAYMESDGASNRGGHVRFTLSSGEILELEAEPFGPKASLSFHKGCACVDRLCSVYVSPGNFTGICDFETTSNLQAGTRYPKNTTGAVVENGFYAS